MQRRIYKMNENVKIDRHFKKETRSLAELLDIMPSYYRNADLSDNITSITLQYRLFCYVKCDTVYDLLHLSPYQILNVKNVGTVYLCKIVEWIIEYCKNDKNKISSSNPQRQRLYIILNSIINNEPLPPFYFSNEEHQYIRRFCQAKKVIPNESLFGIINGSPKYIDLKNFLFHLYDNDEYIQKLNDFLADMKEYIPDKKIYSFAKLYSDTSKDSARFLSRLPKKMLINELPDKLTDTEISSFTTSYSIYFFFKWLTEINIESIAGKIFDGINEWQYDILQRRSNGETLEKIGQHYNCTGEYIRYSEMRAMRTFRHNKTSPYDFLRLIYAVNNRRNLTSADFEPLFEKEQVKILWYIISKRELDCQLFCYSKDDDKLVFDKYRA